MKMFNGAFNRSKLIDEPVVEFLLNKQFSKSNLKFIKTHSILNQNVVCFADGFMRTLNVKRNSAKYFNSPNFTITFDKNNLAEFSNSYFAFIDETANAVYLVDGVQLLKYILAHTDCVHISDVNSKKTFAIIPKKDILDLIRMNTNSVIKYNSTIAKIFEMNRDESLFNDLF